MEGIEGILFFFQIFQKFEYKRICLYSRMDLESVEDLSLSDNTSKSRVLAAKHICKRVRQVASKLQFYAPHHEVFYARTDVGSLHNH